jgi:hypothetical protein
MSNSEEKPEEKPEEEKESAIPEELMQEPLLEEPTLQTLGHHDYSAGDINRALSQLINLNGESITHEVTCLICSNPHRQEIEEEWSKSQGENVSRVDKIREFIKQKSRVTLPKNIIENHMHYHYEKGIKEIQKVEYAGRISRLNNVNLTTLDRIKLCLSALTERLVTINSLVPNTDLSDAEIEKMKSQETARLTSSFNSLLKLQAGILGEMKDSGDLVTIPTDSFVGTFNQALADAKTEEAKQAIGALLDELMSISGSLK